jgi:hypothetical protein
LSPDQRAERILRDKYGLKTLEEQQLSQKQMENINEQRRKLQEMKRKAELNEEIDIIAMIPGPVQIAIDRFLKIGLGISGESKENDLLCHDMRETERVSSCPCSSHSY